MALRLMLLRCFVLRPMWSSSGRLDIVLKPLAAISIRILSLFRHLIAADCFLTVIGGHARTSKFWHSPTPYISTLQSLGVLTRRFQYFPDPARFRSVDYSELRGFFGQRNENLDSRHVRSLFENVCFERFTIHHASDPGCKGIVSPSRRECRAHKIAMTNWFENHDDYLGTLEQANFFIAPRLREGIGISFLEAMAMGMAVAASDQPTMNEYITHQVNGYLCNFDSLALLDVSRFSEVGKRARQSIEAGHICWSKERQQVLDFIFEETRNFQNPVPSVHFIDRASAQSTSSSTLRNLQVSAEATPTSVAMSGGLRTSGLVKEDSPEKPLVTVAMVVLNAGDKFRTTIVSILEQSYDNLELIVMDGGSHDGTLDLIRTYDGPIDLWISEKDEGPYFAMNKAARFASGRWILFMNAGDWFLNAEAISNALRYAPGDADFIIGHHVYRTEAGREEFHKANDSDISWNLLQRGKLNGHWLQGIPGHQATFTRVALLREYGYDTTFRIAADHDFFYRMKENARNIRSATPVCVAMPRPTMETFDKLASCSTLSAPNSEAAFLEVEHALGKSSSSTVNEISADPSAPAFCTIMSTATFTLASFEKIA